MSKYIFFLLLIVQFLNCKKTNSVDFSNKNEKSADNNFTSHVTSNMIKGDFNADMLEDYIKISEFSEDEKTISIFLGKKDGKFTKSKSFNVLAEDFQEVSYPLENIFVSSEKPGEIIIGASCCGNFKITETYYYKFIGNNWFLYKSVISTVDDDFIPTVELEFADLSQSIDGKISNNKATYKKEYEYLVKETSTQLNQYLKNLRVNYNAKSLHKIKSFGINEISEILYFHPITEENIDKYNDLAYYNSFTKEGGVTSIILLKKIIDNFPQRVVAYLNLADSYWSINNKEKAKENYLKYIELMKSQNKDISKIPERVFQRSR